MSSIFSPGSKSSSNTTAVSNDNRQEDNRVSSQGGLVQSTAGGALTFTDSHGAVSGGANSIFNFGADSNDLHQAVQDAAQNASASSLLGALSSAAAPATSPAPGGSKLALYIGAGVALAAIMVLVLARRR